MRVLLILSFGMLGMLAACGAQSPDGLASREAVSVKTSSGPREVIALDKDAFLVRGRRDEASWCAAGTHARDNLGIFGGAMITRKATISGARQVFVIGTRADGSFVTVAAEAEKVVLDGRIGRDVVRRRKVTVPGPGVLYITDDASGLAWINGSRGVGRTLRGTLSDCG